MTNICVIPDCQVRPGDDTEYLSCIGRFLVKRQPDVVVNIGDFADMPSLSSYDIGKKTFEGRRYRDDIDAGREAMASLLQPIKDFNAKARQNHEKQYQPRMILTLGNHEERIIRATNSDPKLDGTISIDDLEYQKYWEVYPYLQPMVINGVAFCHYFTSGVAGRACSTAQMMLNKKHMSCIAGHQQGKQIASGYRADGMPITCIIAGSCYEHDEDYLGPQGNQHWRGIIMLYDVHDGIFDEHFLSLKYLNGKYRN